MVVAYDTSLPVFRRKARVEVSSNTTCQFFFVHKNKHTGLGVDSEGGREEALVVLQMFNGADDLMSRVNCVGAVRRSINCLVTRSEELLLDCLPYMRWKGGRQQ